MYIIRKVFRFEAAHRLMTAYSEACLALHGHSYVVEVFISSMGLNNDAMVIDFGELKQMVGGLIEQWDHAVILGKNDCYPPPLAKIKRLADNPTAETMAYFLFQTLRTRLCKAGHTCIGVEAVRVHETDTGYAEYRKD